ncbi:MAG: helix-turn-helix transcriptional regulator [Eubacterium sp.]|nr:helix-turn-helix transcriptional regulator [Eubacterium sp.]
MDIGSQLRNLLEQEGITQKELAEALNISATTLNGYIQNRRQPDAKTVIRLASYFHTTTDYIYGITTIREPLSSPYNAEEQHLVNIYRGIPEDKKPLYIETGRTFSNFGKKKRP